VSQCHSVHQKSHMDWPGIEPGPPAWAMVRPFSLGLGKVHWLLANRSDVNRARILLLFCSPETFISCQKKYSALR
jgi:hypothetical protein